MADFDFRPLESADIPLLHEWLNRPHVAGWWDDEVSLDDVHRKYDPRLANGASVSMYIAWHLGEPIGFIQSYVAAESGDGWWPDVRDPGVLGIDQFLADVAQLGRGLGTAMVRAFVAQLFANNDVTRIQVDPAPGNARAIRCYEKAGFRHVGEVDTPDGTALLMVCERDDRSAAG